MLIRMLQHVMRQFVVEDHNSNLIKNRNGEFDNFNHILPIIFTKIKLNL